MPKITVNALKIILHLKQGGDITLTDKKNDNIASAVMSEIKRGARTVRISDEDYIFRRNILGVEQTRIQYSKYIPDPCPNDDDPCLTIAPPTIVGVPSEPLTVGEGEEFDPIEGITAHDGNGEPLEVTVTLEQ